jgi:hypothetical protein
MDTNNFPENIQQKITDEFLMTFKTELDKILIGRLPDNPTYMDYQWFDNTDDYFYPALKTTCSIHNTMELYEYLQNLGCYYNEALGGKLTEMLYERNIIEKGKLEDIYPDPFDFELPDLIYELGR